MRHIKDRNRKMSFIILLASVFLIPSSYAFENSGIHFSDSHIINEYQLKLKGVGLKRAFFMKAFVAGFYLKENISTDKVFDNVPKRIEVTYFMSIPGKKLSNYTETLMKKNMSKHEFKLLQERIKVMREYFVDLRPGDRYALTYIPDLGTKFEYNGELVGVIEGEDFANGLFSTWIGKKPMDKKIKNQILGLATNSSISANMVLTKQDSIELF